MFELGFLIVSRISCSNRYWRQVRAGPIPRLKSMHIIRNPVGIVVDEYMTYPTSRRQETALNNVRNDSVVKEIVRL